MKRVSGIVLTVLLVAATASTLSAQQSIYMLVDSIRGDQVAPHDREFRLNSFSAASSNPAVIGTATTGTASGKVAFSPVKVSMRFQGPSNAAFNRHLAAGTKLPSIEVRFYNTSNRIFYKTVFENVLLTSLATEAADDGVQQIEFMYSRVKWFAPPDPAGLNAPVQVGCWDLALAKSC